MWKVSVIIRITVKFDDNHRVTPVSFFGANFDLFSFESDNYMIELLYCTLLYCYIKAK